MQALIDICGARPEAGGGLCACLESSVLSRLRASAADLRLPPGTRIFSRGEAADCVYGLRSGSAILALHRRDGRRQIVGVLLPGDLFGFPDDGRRGCDATALEPVGLCRIPLAAARDDPALERRLLERARAAAGAAMEHLLRLGRMDALERCAWFLAFLWSAKGRPAELYLPVRTADIADFLGLQPETVSRRFTEMRRLRLISNISPDHFIHILDGGGLVALAGAA